MSAHTPGPWTVRRSHEGYEIESALGPVTTDAGMSLADARLIAAAPDLLAALMEQVAEFDKRLREYVEGGNDAIARVAMEHHGERMNRARATIAKAVGK